MRKIINLRGGNASGKTTCVREFLKKHQCTLETIQADKFKSDVTIADDGKIVVCGNYAQEGCTGADRYKGGGQLIPTIREIIRSLHPQYIIYEGYIYSTIAGLNKDIVALGRTFGYEWIGIVLKKDLKKQMKDLHNRNKGTKAINPTVMIERNDRIRRAGENMKKIGVKVKTVDVTSLEKAQMGEILNEEIQ